MAINDTTPVKEPHKSEVVKRRTKGEKTREKILFSAIEILALSGIKGTTHRAIASHAQLQLSLTTYYFKDIKELIKQAFTLNSTRILLHSDRILESIFEAITQIDKKELKKSANKQVLCEKLSDMVSMHLVDNIKNHAIPLTVEQLMLTEAQVNTNLHELIEEHELAQLAPYEHLCSFFNKINPELDAKILHTVFSQLQYSQLSNQINIDTNLIEQTTRRLFGWIIGIKQR